MIFFSVILLGLIQGLAEFLPISSSGHLAIFKTLLPGLGDMANDMTLDILLHLGTLIAVFVVYHKTIFSMIREFFVMIAEIFKGKFKMRKANKYQLMDIYVLLASLPLILAFVVDDYIEKMTSLILVGFMLFITAGLLFIADHTVKKENDILKMKPVHAIKIGFFQLFAILPGVSRSGSTISAAVNMGFSRETAVEFSFILGIPAVIGANILNVADIINTGIDKTLILPYIVGVAVAAVSGILAIRLVKYITQKDKFGWFVWYCAAAGVVAIVLGLVF